MAIGQAIANISSELGVVDLMCRVSLGVSIIDGVRALWRFYVQQVADPLVFLYLNVNEHRIPKLF